jgi:hypothetical protein
MDLTYSRIQGVHIESYKLFQWPLETYPRLYRVAA